MENKKTIKKETTKAVVKINTKVSAPFNQDQLRFMLGRTPAKHIYTRPGKGGGQWEYVTGIYVKKVLNYCFGWMWDFEVKEHGREDDLIWVLGKLLIKNKTGKVLIAKEQFGRADIKFKKGTKIMLDFGNDLKSATTDALKKCASELGIAGDVYGKNEFKDIRRIEGVSEGVSIEQVTPVKSTKGELETIVMNTIKKTNGVGALIDIDNRIQESNMFSKAFKKRVHEDINKRVEVLNK